MDLVKTRPIFHLSTLYDLRETWALRLTFDAFLNLQATLVLSLIEEHRREPWDMPRRKQSPPALKWMFVASVQRKNLATSDIVYVSPNVFSSVSASAR